MATYVTQNNFNSTARDNVLIYQLENTVGAFLEIRQDENSTNNFLVELKSKSGAVLSSQQLVIATPTKIERMYLDPTTANIVVIYEDQTRAMCNLHYLFNECIQNKQDKLTAGSGITIKNNVVSIAPGFGSGLAYEEIVESHDYSNS